MLYAKRAVKVFEAAGASVGIFLILSVMVLAADGSGTNSVSPTSVNAGSTGNTLTFTFTPSETMDSGGITIAVPSDWSTPQGSASTTGYTTVTSASGKIADVKDSADSTSGWTVATGKCNLGFSADTSVFYEGTASLLCQNSGSGNGNGFYKNITAENWSSYTNIAFWVRATSQINSGSLRFSYDNNSDLASAIENLNLPLIPANTWTYVNLTFTGVRTSVASYGFNINGASASTNNIRIDDILIGPGSPSFPGSGIISARLLQLASGQTVVVTYGSGGGSSGATVPTAGTSATFSTKSRTSSSGTLTNISSQPTVTIVGGTVSGSSGRAESFIIRFWGKAFPEGKITLYETSQLTGRTNTVSSVAGANGDFAVQLPWGDRSGNYSYSLIIEDKDMRRSQTKVYNIDATTQLDRYIFAPPTLDFAEAVIQRGHPLTIIGYATPNNNVIIEANGSVYRTVSGPDGKYRLSANIDKLSLGQHNLKAKQQNDITKEESEYSLIKTFSLVKIPVQIDFNNDGAINISDWSIFLSTWSKTGEERNVIDLNKDGKIDISDLSLFLEAFNVNNNNG